MSERKMTMLFKSIRISFFVGQIILFGLAGYLLLTNSKDWSYPFSLFSIQQIILWIGYIYYSKKMNINEDD